jgi:FtsH-binding integral membrane protein
MAWIAPTRTNSRPFSAASPRGVAARLDADVRTFLQKVYVFMSLGLATTGLVALAVVSSPAALALVFGNRLVFFGLLIAQLGLVVAFSRAATRVSTAAAMAMFFGYAALSGVTFAAIFLRYTMSSIGGTFLITGGMFASLSAYGVLTKRDLSSLGSFCMMGLVGLVLASVVNLFWGNSALYWLTTFVGVIVFTGLTAYDNAKLKQIGVTVSGDGGAAMTRVALQGALVLYLDFINLFLMLLRVFGGRRRD